jgi:ParB family chromosome partitioning protein
VENTLSTQKRGLGRGLSALIPTAAELTTQTLQDSSSKEIAVDRITPSPFQPRHTFDEAKIDELAASIHTPRSIGETAKPLDHSP